MELKELKRTKNSTKKSVVLKGSKASKMAENELKKYIRMLLRELDVGFRNDVINQIPSQYIDGAFTDANYASLTVSLTNKFAKKFKKRYKKMNVKKKIKMLFNKQARLNREKFNRSVNDSLGVDLDKIMASDGLSSFQNAQEIETVEYISRLIDETISSYSATTLTKLGRVSSLGDLYKAVKEETSMKLKRGDLVARNQLKEFNTQLSEKRATKLAIQKARWKTGGDERVRCTHRALGSFKNKDGTVGIEFDISKGVTMKLLNSLGISDSQTCDMAVKDKDKKSNRTMKFSKEMQANGDKLKPGEGINCRCYAEYVVEF